MLIITFAVCYPFIAQLLSESGELNVMAKRRSGFLPSRGKKDAGAPENTLPFNAADDATAADASSAFEDAAAVRLAFLNDLAANKRSSGFLPMRGRKSASSDFEEVMEKRRVASFMPMRGRKWEDASMGGGQAEMAVPAAVGGVASHYWLPSSGNYFHAALPAAAQQHPAPMFYYPVKSGSAR